MIYRFILPLSLLGALHAAPKKGTDGWAVDGAPWRVQIHADKPPDIPEAGWEIRLPDFGSGRPDMRDVVLFDANGKEISLDAVWRGAGRSLLLLAESMPEGAAAATLYFGGESSRRMKSWTAKRSLLLEIRRLPAGTEITSYAGWQEAWKKSPSVDGMAFVPLIFHGENPFGDDSHFLSRYTGLIKTGDGGEMKFYTLSDDVSYVSIDGRPMMKWQKNQPPPLDPRKVPMVDVRVPKSFVEVEYDHAVKEAPCAMVLGWDEGGKPGNVPPDAWIHPGKTIVGSVEGLDHSPVPLPELTAERYLGYGGAWYVNIKGDIENIPEPWQVEWLWPDGRVDHGLHIRRLWMSLEPARVVVRIRNGARMIEGRRVLVIPRNMEAASVNDQKQLAPFLELLASEDPAVLAETDRKAGFLLARDFLATADAVKWADAWVKSAKPEAGPWVTAMMLTIRELQKVDPKAALERLSSLSPAARATMGREADALELDIRVFDLRDPLIVSFVERLSKAGDPLLAKMAKIRLGDYQLLMGRTEDAIGSYQSATRDQSKDDGKGPVMDRAHSLALEDLIHDGHANEAQEKLNEWERKRPIAKIEGDLLYWQARLHFLQGNWQRSLLDLETSLKIRPGSAEEIDVLFWQGRALYELNRKDEAHKIWNSLIKDYPKHERAEAAKQWTEKN